MGHYGGAVSLRGGREIKLINLVVHDCPNRTGIGGSNLGSEFYGCLIYRNGQWANALAHGTYTQNRPEDVGGNLERAAVENPSGLRGLQQLRLGRP